MSFAQVRTEDRRLVLLRLLADSPGYAANAYLLTSAAGTMGHSVSHDAIRGDLSWLAEQDLVRCDEVGDVTIAALTTRGLDVSAGRTSVPGVKRPLPTAI